MAAPLAVSTVALAAIRFIHCVYPPALFVWFVASQTATVCTLANLSAPRRELRKQLFVFLQIAIIASYVAEAILQCVRSLSEEGWWSSSDNVIYLLTSIIVWGIVEVALIDTERPVWYPYFGSWLIAFIGEASLFSLSISTVLAPNGFEIARISVQGSRILLFAAVPLGLWAVRNGDLENSSGEESTRLLGSEAVRPSTYGSVSDSDCEVEDTRDAKAKMLKKIEESGNWWTYAKSFSIFWPFIWPKNERWLQLSMALVGLCLVVERGLNVMVPHQLGVVTNSLMRGNGRIPWAQLLLYVLYRWLDSGSGVSALQGYLWMPIDQYTHRTLTTAAYNHVMSLSYDFHSDKKTGEIWSSIAQGRSVNGFIESVLFQVLPMLADLCVAFTYFYILFDVYMALIVAVVSVVYLWVTAKLSAMRNEMRRELNQYRVGLPSVISTEYLMNKIGTMQVIQDSLQHHKAVLKANNSCPRKKQAIRLFQKAERKWLIGISVLNVAQSLIFTIGLLAASFLAVYEVTRGKQPVGSFVTLLSYWAQLSGPLTFFANFYRKVQTQMLDAERLLELFKTKASVSDNPKALELEKIEGDVVFENVCFSYDSRKSAITDVSFHVPAGSTVAFVGETGGGKTTCLKLLFRFYDVASGSIKIDGQDIRDIKTSSMRSHMGVVPQDPHLFNDTIMSNIKYANFDATDEDVYEACRAASIHEKILSFPDGYLSKVGERGVRLSGGELQRVSIARAILKNPKIILLDEATSMIDMETERHIQDAFSKLAKDRTMFIVAHRLSTVMNADLIIVIKEGKIIEKGSHDQLLQSEGKYFQLWSKQLKPDDQPPKPEDRKPLLIEDLLQELHSDDTLNDVTPPSRDVKQIGIPGTPDGGKRTRKDSTPHPTVTFSLPERTLWGLEPRSQPLLNSRMPTPNHGILKHVSSQHGSIKLQENLETAPKPASFLKPDAKEFVPRSVPIVAYGSGNGHLLDSNEYPPVQDLAHPSSMLHEMSPEGLEEPGQEGQIESPARGMGIEEAQSKALHSPRNLGTFLQQEYTRAISQPESLSIGELDHLECPESYVEDTGNDLETDNPQETKKRRRRTRRRSHKSKSGEVEEDVKADGAVVASLAVVSPYLMGDEHQEIDAENSGTTNGSIGKPKRRFRNGYKSKCPDLELESEEPLSTLQVTENLANQFKDRPRTGSFTINSTRFSAKEDQIPGNTPKHYSSSCSSIRVESTQRKNSGSGKPQDFTKGSWRKGRRKSKSIESGNSTSEA